MKSYKVINEYEKIKLDAFFEQKDVKELLANIKTEGEETDGFKRLIISTEHVDRTGEIVRQDGLDSELYMKNPVILNSHNYYGIENIVGKTTKLYKEVIDGVPCTLADGVWAPTEAGQMAKQLWDAGCLSAASIGFIPEEFDETNSAIITKWQMLEFSMVPVPANGNATRDSAVRVRLQELGIDERAMRVKGFEVKREPTGEAEVGDECSMDDGTVGVFTANEHGVLVCIPKQNSMKSAEEVGGGGKDDDVSEASMWADLKAEHDMHEKAVKGHVKEYVEAMKAEHEKPEEGESEEDKKAFALKITKAIEEHEKKFKTVMKAEHARHIKCVQDCVDCYSDAMHGDDDEDNHGGASDHDADNEKVWKAVAQAIEGKQADDVVKILMVAGKSISESVHKKLAALCESIEEGHGMHEDGAEIHTKAIDEFKALLAAHEPNEGDETSEEDPEKRSIPVELDFNDPEFVRALNTATREALTRYNKGMSGKRAR